MLDDVHGHGPLAALLLLQQQQVVNEAMSAVAYAGAGVVWLCW